MKQNVNIKVSPRGMSFAGVLTLIFVAAKIVGLIAWSWWLVFLPILILPTIAIGLLLVMLILGGIIAALN